MKAFDITNVLRACIFLVLFVIALTALNPKVKDIKNDIQINGDLIVQIQWPNEIPSDLDLWVQTPGDSPVGFSRKVGKSITLMKDDLGIIPNDLSGMNYELAVSQTIVPGDYHVNVVLYSLHDFSGDIPVTVIVTYRRGSSIILNKKIDLVLKTDKSIVTAINFSLDDDKGLLPESVNNDQYEMDFK